MVALIEHKRRIGADSCVPGLFVVPHESQELRVSGYGTGYMAGPCHYERIEDAGHWIPLDQPEGLNDLLLEFL